MKKKLAAVAASSVIAILLSGCGAINIGSVEKYSESESRTVGTGFVGEDYELNIGYAVSGPNYPRLTEVAGVRIPTGITIGTGTHSEEVPVEVAGLEWGFYNSAETTGCQWGLVNHIVDTAGFQLSLVNLCRQWEGFQMGVVNYGKWWEGVQLGVVNYADDWDGIQVGLVNYTPQGFVPFMIGVNWTKEKSEDCD